MGYVPFAQVAFNNRAYVSSLLSIPGTAADDFCASVYASTETRSGDIITGNADAHTPHFFDAGHYLGRDNTGKFTSVPQGRCYYCGSCAELDTGGKCPNCGGPGK